MRAGASGGEDRLLVVGWGRADHRAVAFVEGEAAGGAKDALSRAAASPAVDLDLEVILHLGTAPKMYPILPVMAATFTLLDSQAPHLLSAHVTGGRVRIPADAVREALGWSLEPQGLCRGSVCIPVREREALVSEEGLDLETLAIVLDRPLAVDPEACAAALGTAAADRSGQLASLEAPDFTLPDLDGNRHSLSEHRGKKVLLIAYASW